MSEPALDIYPEWPRWLTLEMAARYSPFGVKMLKHLAEEGHIRGAKVPYRRASKWVFDRESIDDYINNHMFDEKELEMCKRFGL